MVEPVYKKKKAPTPRPMPTLDSSKTLDDNLLLLIQKLMEQIVNNQVDQASVLIDLASKIVKLEARVNSLENENNPV